MPFSFPSSPAAGQQSTQNGRVYQWSGSAWQLVTTLPAHTHTAIQITDFTAAASSAAPVQSVAGRTGAVTIAVADVSGAVASNDARLSDTRTPTDGSVTDSSITSGGLSASSINWVAIAPWAANTAYAKGDLVSHLGVAYRRSAAGTSEATFNTANWQQVTPGEFVGSQITSGTVPIARLGSGTTDATTYLRGDSTFAPAVTSVDGQTGAVSITKVTVLDFTVSSAPSGFTGSSGSWSGNLPTGWKFIDAIIVGAGGGGGSGRSGASNTSRGGGGGGGGGAITIARVSAADFSANTCAVVVRSGGAGGAAVTETGDGQAGSPVNLLSTTATIGGTLVLEAQGGQAGSGGTSASGGGGGSGRPISNLGVGRFAGNSGGAGGFAAAGAADNRGQYYSLYQKGGGGGGGAGNGTQFAGAVGGLPCGELCGYETTTQASAGTAGGGTGGSATAGTGLRVVGASGGGGGGSAAGAGGKGGDALNYGGGGGGGGAGTAGAGGSGAGGNGGPGFVRLVVWS